MVCRWELRRALALANVHKLGTESQESAINVVKEYDGLFVRTPCPLYRRVLYIEGGMLGCS